jgi:RimJ/RimL family protein N-acetyltransferase
VSLRFSKPCPPRLEPVVLTGQFVRLEPLETRHIESFTVAALSDPGIWDYMRRRIETTADVAWLFHSALADAENGLSLPFAVIDLHAEALVGSTRFLDYVPVDRGIEIGWTWYVPEARGGPVNLDAKCLLMRHAFEELGCIRVQLKTDARNLRSRAAIAKLGATEEGTLRNHMVVQGDTIRNSVYFSVLDDEWPRVQAGLQARLEGGNHR